MLMDTQLVINMCFLRGISSLRSDTALTDAEFALTDAEFLANYCVSSDRRCMAAQPCTKCGENPRGGNLSPYASLWRACPDDDELCDWCRDDIEWTKAFFSEPLSEQLMFAASFGDLRRVEILINQGASLSCAHSGIGTSTSAPAPAPAGDGKQCMFRLTAAAAALLEFDEGQFDDVYGIIKLLVRWDADCHTRVVCETHGGGEIPLDCLHGLSPLEMAQKHDSRPFREGVRWKMATIIQDRLFRGRERRGTPVKERAKKAGVALPPTPDGVRDAIDSGTPETQRRARKQLQRHQKHCQQKVSRAEVAGDIEKWTRPAAKDAARKRRKKGEEKTVVRALI